MCQSDMDIQFSPSQWSKKSQGTQRCEEYIECIEKYSKIVKQSIPCKVNISYGSGKREVIDVYGTDLPDDSPVLIYFHGGYWQEPTIRHDNNSYVAKNLYENKVKTILVGYELCPNVTLERLIENIKNAVKLCLTLVDTSQIRGIHLCGHSAGAQIVAILYKDFIPSLPESQQNLFKSAFLIAGIYDLLPLLATSYNEILKLDVVSATNASPLHQKLKPTKCEIVVIAAEYDSPRFIEQGEKMHQHMKELGFKSQFVLRKTADHFDVVEDLFDNNNEVTKIIINYCT